MTSHELARKLLASPDVEVLRAQDDEGNGFDTVHELVFWDAEETWQHTEWECAEPSVVIW